MTWAMFGAALTGCLAEALERHPMTGPTIPMHTAQQVAREAAAELLLILDQPWPLDDT